MRRGFTLIELLVVVGILGVIVAIAIPLFARYVNKAYRGTVMADVRNAVASVEAFIGDFKNVPNTLSCPTSGYGPATCDLTDGTNTLSGAIAVSRNTRLNIEKFSCGSAESYRIHGVHALLPGWGYCFNACTGTYTFTDGSGCP